MDIAKKVLEEIKNGASPEDLAKKISWKELSGDDFSDLLTIALRLKENQQSYNLLVYLFNISFGKDLWVSTEVLGQAVQHPNMTSLDRQAILPTMRSRLDQIKDQIAIKAPSEEKLIKYWLMEATYYAVNGTMLAETSHKVEATQNFKIAQSIFEQLGMTQKASEYKSLSRRLLSSDVLKTPLPKTSPIRFNLPPTQPIGGMGPAQTRPAEPISSPKPEPGPSSTRDEVPALETTVPRVPEPAAIIETGPTIELPAALTAQPAAAEVQSTPVQSIAIITATPTPPAAAKPVETGVSSAQPILTPSMEMGQSQPLARREGSTVAGIYYPLPDVWLEEGRLFILGMEKFLNQESLDQTEQIRQQSEILVGIQLQIQMYLSRRTMLEKDMKWMEKRALALKEKIAKLENKLIKLETTD